MKDGQLKRLKLEHLENRELLSATTWDVPSETGDAAAFSSSAAVVDETIDLSAFCTANLAEESAETVAKTWIVDSAADDGSEGTLRYAIENAADGDSITFADSLKGASITLTQGQLSVATSLTIDALNLYDYDQLTGRVHHENGCGLTIDANLQSRILDIQAGADVKVLGVNFVEGSVKGDADEFDHGGALHVPAGAKLTLDACVVSNSYADMGGGAVAVTGEFYASNTIFENNDGGADSGGAIRIFGGRVEVADCHFRNNKIEVHEGDSQTGGGGAVGASGGVFYAFDTHFTGNQAFFGGAFFVAGGEVFLSNSLLEGNGAPGSGLMQSGTYHGGAIDVDAGTLTLVNTTVTNNTASYGGGLYLNSDAGNLTVNIYNSIIAENNAQSSGFIPITGEADVETNGSKLVVNGYNVLSSFENWSNAGKKGVVNYEYNAAQPLFNDAENGDYTLAANSQAIDKGNDAYAVDINGAPLGPDYQHQVRSAGAAVDLGAYEYGSTPYFELAKPSDMTFANYDATTGSFDISWTDNNDGDVAFRVEVSEDNATWSYLEQVLPTGATSVATTIGEGETLYYRVRAERTMAEVSDWLYGSYAAPTVAVRQTPTITASTPAPAENGEYYVATTIQIAIGCVEGATDYQVQIATDPNFENVKDEFVTKSDQDADLYPNERVRLRYRFDADTTYYVRVKALGAVSFPELADANVVYADSEWSETAVYTTTSLYLATPTLTAEARGTDAVTVSLGYVSFAESYVVEYSTDPNFATFETATFNDDGAHKIAGLQDGTTYYFRAKAASAAAGVVPSDYAEVVSATTVDATVYLGAPTLTAEATETTVAQVALGYVAFADSYVVEYSTDPNFGTFETKTFTSNGVKRIAGLNPNATYYFRASVAGAEGADVVASDYSEVVSATTEAIVLAAPSVSVAARGADSATVTLGFVSAAANYVVEYSTDPNFETFETATFTTNGAKKIAGLDFAATYYFRASAAPVAGGAYVASETTAVYGLQAQPTISAQPAPRSTNGAYHDFQTFEISLGCVDQATDYVVEIATDANFDNVVRTVHTKSDQAHDLFPNARVRLLYNFDAGQTYFVRAKALGESTFPEVYGAEIAFSDSIWSATATVATPSLELTTPTIAATQKTATAVTVTLGYVSFADSYVVEYSTNADFSDAKTKTFSYSGAKSISGLDANATYYFRAKVASSISGAVDSAWTDAVSNVATSAALLSEAFDDCDFAFDDDELENLAKRFF